MESLQDQQVPVFEEIARALIAATPEWWSTATLELTTKLDGSGSTVAHSIHNPDYPRDIVVPTDELFAATRQLELVSQAHGDRWTRCVFRIEQQNENWRYVVDFERE